MRPWIASFVIGIVAGSSIEVSHAQDHFDFDTHILFLSTFDDTTDANLFGFDNDAGWIYTAESTKLESKRMGNHCPEVTIADGAGVMRDSLLFSDVTKGVLYYEATPNLPNPRMAWSGTVCLWLKPDEYESLEEDVMPLMFFDGDWQNGGFYLRFPKQSPTKLEFGVVTKREKTKDSEFDLSNVEQTRERIIVAKEQPFDADNWKFVAFTYENVNPVGGDPTKVKLYFDGELVDSWEAPIEMGWMHPETADKEREAVVFLGENYTGQMDDFRLYNRALTELQLKLMFDSAH